MILKSLSEITINPENPRIFSESAIEKIVRSLKDLPTGLWLNPIKLNANDVILAGNLRTTGASIIFALGTTERGKILKAFQNKINASNNSDTAKNEAIKQAKAFFIEKKLPCVYADTLTEAQEKEFLIKDNLVYADWDMDALTANFDLGDISDWGMDLEAMQEITDYNDDEAGQGETDYSDKNREVDIDTLDETMQLKFIYSKDQYFDIQERLNVVCAKQNVNTKEDALIELLNFYERNNG